MAAQWPSHPPQRYADIEFTETPDGVFDHVVVLNGIESDLTVHCPPDRVWAFIQEPPFPQFRHMHLGQRAFSRVYTTDERLKGERYRAYWGALQWHVGLSYDMLASAPYPAKTVDLTWVTSNKSWLPGHQLRMRFLDQLQRHNVPVELWGRGFRLVERKWDALAPSRYSIAFENFSGSWYWSEKLADCFLSFTTPLYYGCRTIDRYFPKCSYIYIDPNDPFVFERIKSIIRSSYHEDNREALQEARELCLRRYNSLFFIADEVMSASSKNDAPKKVRIKGLKRSNFFGKLLKHQ